MNDSWDALRGPARLWEAAGWSIEVRGDELAAISWEGRPVLRSIRAVVRDEDWNTAETVVERVVERIVERIVETEAEVATLTLHIRAEGFGAQLHGLLEVRAEPGALTVRLRLETPTPYRTNRTGLVALHSPALAGTPMTVEHQNGTAEQRVFPMSVAPHQPAADIEGLAWQHEGLAIRMRFAGDLFEMEDQRNWTDASYKTYNRPLSLPFPYLLDAASAVEQEIAVTVASVDQRSATTELAATQRRRPGAGDPSPIELGQVTLFPALDVGASTAPDPAPAASVRAEAVLVELDLGTNSWQAALQRAGGQRAGGQRAGEQRAGGQNIPLDVRITADAGADLAPVVSALRNRAVARIAVFDAQTHVTERQATASLRRLLRNAGMTVPVLSGARSHFTELNREQSRLPTDTDGVTFAITPLFHSGSTYQLVESIPMQRLVAEDAVRIAGGRPVHIGPVTLRSRFNNVATATATAAGTATATADLMASTETNLVAGYGATLTGLADARQQAEPLAAWLVASAIACAIPGVESLTYFEQWGERGLLLADGTPTPGLAAFDVLQSLRGKSIVSGRTGDDLVWAIVTGDNETVVVANLDTVPRTVSLSAGISENVTIPPESWKRVRGR
ncbi:hypothetical protein [Lysinibacter cavernae]|uniref:Uncharacterized protein n=1 Tax=Lysinibacter cavernae TaxID=1640652 RepID=A0A7X5TTM2_9MICO|nr:hypothetical protein [Lysinibacter cavernae]NIH53423.1 hypothetical protein [Lysinibacter cavernae]